MQHIQTTDVEKTTIHRGSSSALLPRDFMWANNLFENFLFSQEFFSGGWKETSPWVIPGRKWEASPSGRLAPIFSVFMSKLDSFTRDQHSPKETCSVANHLSSAIFIHWQSDRLSPDKINTRLSFTSAHKRAGSSEGIQRSRGRERAHTFHCRHIPSSTSILTLVSTLAMAPRSSSNPIREAAVTHVDVNNTRNGVSLSSRTGWSQQPLRIQFFYLLLGVLFCTLYH